MNALNIKEEEHIIDEVKSADTHTHQELEKLRAEIRELKSILLAQAKN